MSAIASLFLRFTLRGLWQNKVRTVLTVLGIALGVAVMLAINVANSSALAKFSETIDLVSGKTNLSIVPRTQADIEQSLLARLQFLYDQDIKSTPVIDQIVVLGGDRPEVAQLLGLDMIGDKEFRQVDQTSGQTKDKKPDSSFEIFRTGHVLVGSALAARHQLKVGDTLKIYATDREVECTVTGVLGGDGLGKAFSGNVIVMDIGCAQALLSMGERISRIDLIIPEEKRDTVTRAINAVLPPGVGSERPARRGEQVEKMLHSFQYNLAALSLIALLVGMFLIYNTMSISVIRRRTEIGTLRALGTSRRAVFTLFISEALMLGGVGSLLGIGGGLFFAQFAIKAITRTVNSLYIDQPAGAVVVEPQTLYLALAVGMAMTLCAALAPAIEAVLVPPAEATRRASYERKVQRLSPALALTGVFLLALSVWASLQPAVNHFPVFGYVSAALAVFGCAALSPAVLDLLLKLLVKPLAATIGAEGRLAVLSLHGALGRTSVAVASLMVGISMMVSLAVMIGSFRTTVEAWVAQTLKADLFVQPEARRASGRAGALTPDVVATIRAVPGIAAVDAFVEFPIEYNGEAANLGAGELDVMVKHGNLMFVDGEPSAQVLSRIAGAKAVIVSESFAIKHKINKGDRLNIATPRGRIDPVVEGIYYDYTSDAGSIVFDRLCFRRYFNDTNSSTLSVFLLPTSDPDAVRQAIFAALPADARLSIRTNSELRIQVLKIFDSTFSITYALHAISIAVAILGVANALFALTMEARRELGILKYLGASRQQLSKLVLVQAGLLGTLGNTGGLVVGMMLSFLLIHVINKQSFGWTVQFSLPHEFLLQSFGLIFVCSLLSGLIPARLAERTPAAEVVRSE